MTGAPAALRFESVSVSFGERRALQEVDLEVPSGQFLALAGPNGSGKTTLLRATLGLLPGMRGRVTLLGRPLGELSIRERALRLAWVPQQETLREEVPLARYLLYGRYAFHGPFGREDQDDLAAVDAVLRELGLYDRRHDSVLSLSGGERQRAVLARALAQGTPVLLLDEPTSHLDIGHQLDLLERVRALVERRGLTAVAALHDLNLATRFADRVVVLAGGRKVADGPPAEVLSPELLARVWRIEADLRRDPASGRPYLLPRRLLAAPSPVAPRFGPVHVVGGGGAATPYLRRLGDAGFEVTVGALHLLDSDAETAEALALPAAVEVPFAPLGEATRARHRELLEAARALVVSPFAVGPSNLANLDDLLPFATKVPTWLVREPPIASRDFVQGRAIATYARLLELGAREVAGVDELREELARTLGGLPGGPSPPAPRPARAAEREDPEPRRVRS